MSILKGFNNDRNGAEVYVNSAREREKEENIWNTDASEIKPFSRAVSSPILALRSDRKLSLLNYSY